ncbi:hypothetical protein NP493_972g00060, partial [Ridgeia piscesae]
HAASQGNPGRGRGRPSRQASSVRQTRSRARAVPVDPDSDYAAPSVTVPPSSPPFVDTLPFQPVSFGRPPPQCDELQDFDTAPGLRAVVTDSALARSAWERDMERRVVSSERMLGEIPNLVLNLRPNPAVAAPSAALGSAVQSVSVDMPPGEGRHAVPPVTAPAGHALPPFPDAPWPLVDTFFPGGEGVGRCGGRLAVLRCRLSDLEGSLRVGLGLHQLGALAEGISVAGWSSAGCWAPLSRPDLRLPVRASRSTGASCAAVTPVGTLTSAGSAVEPTLLSDALRPKPTGNPLAPPSHPQVPLVAPRLLVDPRMAQTVGEFHDLSPWANVNPVIVPYSMSPAGLGSL